MRINNNIMAMNTYRQLGIGTAAGAKSMEKLSSGYRINRAGDDAAGLAISEKMRGQIRGLSQASRNAQDGISMIQTAEGALQETHAILQRMRELAVQSANGTNEDADRAALQDEINQLLSEIDRIAETTEFNKQSLLKGDGGIELAASGLVAGATFTPGTDVVHTQATASILVEAGAADGDGISIDLNGITLTVTYAANDADKADGEVTITGPDAAAINNSGSGLATAASGDALANALQALIDNNEILAGNYTVTSNGAGLVTISAVPGGAFDGAFGYISNYTETGTVASYTEDLTNAHGTTTAATAASYEINLSGYGATEIDALIGKGFSLEGVVFEFYNANDGAYTGDAVGINVADAFATGVDDPYIALADAIAAQLNGAVDGITVTSDGAGAVTITAGEKGAGSAISFVDGATVNEEFSTVFQIGANATQTMQVTINDMRTVALKINGVDISTAAGAESAITTIDAAIAAVSDERAKLGAFQNRLEHTIRNLDTSAENLQASESRIRDVDMAKEMMEFTKNSILQQAATAMLAQANQAPQTVLQLLR